MAGGHELRNRDRQPAQRRSGHWADADRCVRRRLQCPDRDRSDHRLSGLPNDVAGRRIGGSDRRDWGSDSLTPVPPPNVGLEPAAARGGSVFGLLNDALFDQVGNLLIGSTE